MLIHRQTHVHVDKEARQTHTLLLAIMLCWLGHVTEGGKWWKTPSSKQVHHPSCLHMHPNKTKPCLAAPVVPRQRNHQQIRPSGYTYCDTRATQTHTLWHEQPSPFLSLFWNKKPWHHFYCFDWKLYTTTPIEIIWYCSVHMFLAIVC